MSYSRNDIKVLQNKLVMLENEKREINEKLLNADTGGERVREWYDAAGDHFHKEVKYVGPSEEFRILVERLSEVEKEIKKTNEELEEAKRIVPIVEEEEKERVAQEKIEEIKEKEETRIRELDERKRTVKKLKATYKSELPLSERISLALQGRKPKWKQIKKLPIDELRFLKMASLISEKSKVEIETRDEQIETDVEKILNVRADREAHDNWNEFDYAERKRREYFLKLLRTRAFLTQEKEKNIPDETIEKSL